MFYFNVEISNLCVIFKTTYEQLDKIRELQNFNNLTLLPYTNTKLNELSGASIFDEVKFQ